MSFSPAFTVSQSAATPNIIVLQDTSTGVDASITQRRIYITDNEGAYIVPSGTSTDYIVWPLATNPISLNVLTQDTAANIFVEWLDVSNTVLYDDDDDYPLIEYGKQFYFYLIQQLALNPSTYQDSNYASNLALFWTYIIGAINAINIGSSLSASQALMNKETDMQNNQSKYF